MASVPWVQVQAAISTEKQHQISSKNAESKSTPELRDSVGLSAPGFVEWFKKPFTTTPAVLTKDQEGSHTLGLKSQNMCYRKY